MAYAELAIRNWRLHHSGALTFESSILLLGGNRWLILPWTGRRIELVSDREDVRGQLRELGFDEERVERLVDCLYRSSTSVMVPLGELVENLV